MAEYGATSATMGGGCTQPHALGSAGIAATIPLKTCPSFILRFDMDFSRVTSYAALLVPGDFLILSIFFELMDEKSLLLLLLLEAAVVLLLVGIEYDAGKGFVPHGVVLSMKRAIWPLLIPNSKESSAVLKLRSSERHFPDASNLSAYCISARSCRCKEKNMRTCYHKQGTRKNIKR